MMKLIINSLYKNKEVSSDSRLIWFLRMTEGVYNLASKLPSNFRVMDQLVKMAV